MTFWLYEYLSSSLKHRACSFVLFRKYVATGEEVNLAFGKIDTLEATISS